MLAPVSEGYLRRLLASTGVRVEQPFAGVRQGSFEELERSLVELEGLYARATEHGESQRAREIRRMVIQSKEHARMAGRNPALEAAKREVKREMAEWMLVWLENPGVFPVWAALRKRARGA